MVLTRYIFYFFKEWQEFCFILLSLMNIDIGVFVVVFKPSSVFQIYTSYRIVSKLYSYNNGIQSVLSFPLAKLWAGRFPLFIKQQKFLKISKLINSWKFDFRRFQTVGRWNKTTQHGTKTVNFFFLLIRSQGRIFFQFFLLNMKIWTFFFGLINFVWYICH